MSTASDAFVTAINSFITTAEAAGRTYAGTIGDNADNQAKQYLARECLAAIATVTAGSNDARIKRAIYELFIPPPALPRVI